MTHVQIYITYATFNHERWRLITLLGGPFDSATDYRDHFADSCDSIGDYTDFHQRNEGAFAISDDMRNFNFPLRNIDGLRVATVAPLDMGLSFFMVCNF